MGLLENLYSLENGHTSGNIETLLQFVVDGKYTPFRELVKDCTSFYFNGQKLLIYGGKNGTMSGCIKEYCEKKFVTVMYDKTELIYDSNFSYDTPLMNCLEDMYNLKKSIPDRWIYRLDPIYRKHGLDIVNAARYCFDYFCI